jgi:PD-(D/E)XK nuclease superfamily
VLNQSLLVTLGSLRRLDKKLFITENFLTAAFAFLLQNDRKFLRDYLDRLGFRLSKLPDVQTQETYAESSDNIPDMVLSDRQTYIIQENKIDARLGSNQLRRYARLVKDSRKKNKGLVYLRRKHAAQWANNHSVNGIRVRTLTWDAVASLLKKNLFREYKVNRNGFEKRFGNFWNSIK